MRRALPPRPASRRLAHCSRSAPVLLPSRVGSPPPCPRASVLPFSPVYVTPPCPVGRFRSTVPCRHEGWHSRVNEPMSPPCSVPSCVRMGSVVSSSTVSSPPTPVAPSRGSLPSGRHSSGCLGFGSSVVRQAARVTHCGTGCSHGTPPCVRVSSAWNGGRGCLPSCGVHLAWKAMSSSGGDSRMCLSGSCQGGAMGCRLVCSPNQRGDGNGEDGESSILASCG